MLQSNIFIKDCPQEVGTVVAGSGKSGSISYPVTESEINQHCVWFGGSLWISNNCRGSTWGELLLLPFVRYWSNKNTSFDFGRKRFALILKQMQLSAACLRQGDLLYTPPWRHARPNTRGEELQPCRGALFFIGGRRSVRLSAPNPSQNPLNKQSVLWCLTVCTAHAPLTSGRQWPPLPSLTYSLARSILPSCSNWHLVQRQADRGPLCPAPPEMWPSCQPSNPVQPPPEPGRNSRLVPPLSSRLEAQQTTQPSSTLQTARREGSSLLVKSVSTGLYKSNPIMWRRTLEACLWCVQQERTGSRRRAEIAPPCVVSRTNLTRSFSKMWVF